MVPDLSSFVPFLVAFVVLGTLAALVSLAVITDSVVRHRRVRVANHQSIPTYYRRLVLAH